MPTPLSSLDPDHLYQRLVALGHEWSDADAAASALEETRKSVLAEVKLSCEGKTVAEREAQALAGVGYRDHVAAMVEARRKANRARVNYNVALVWADVVRSKEATARAEMTLR